MSANTTDAASPPAPLPGMDALTELAMDLRWSWNHYGYFRQLIDRNGAQQALYPYNDPGQFDYHATVSSARPVTDYTPRIMMRHDSMAQDLEPGWMLWQK